MQPVQYLLHTYLQSLIIIIKPNPKRTTTAAKEPFG
jgi:hypothetical protein